MAWRSISKNSVIKRLIMTIYVTKHAVTMLIVLIFQKFTTVNIIHLTLIHSKGQL